ncbi:MAG: phenylalanine--tRNA ligase subunit alpha [Acidobacteriota bacterium]
MLSEIKQTREEFSQDLEKVRSLTELAAFRDRYLGRKSGRLTAMMKRLQSVSSEGRRELGQALNVLRSELETALEERRLSLESQQMSQRLAGETEDITLPGNSTMIGHPHPLSLVEEEVEKIFLAMGYSVEEGPEIERTYYNFEALNIPEHHPARDAQDTFYISDSLVLRTHTSPVQIRTMERRRPPLRIICPGRVFRRDNPDATHSPVFHQVEGLAVDERLTFLDFKGTLEFFLKSFFGEDIRVRFRPSYFAFTEPSAEVDISCIFCAARGCRVCKMSGWIEVLGAGMVDPAVFRYVGYDPEVYSGFAFGIGIERFAMIKFNIDNIPYFCENDMRFLEQF